jgi:hypothetical protein
MSDEPWIRTFWRIIPTAFATSIDSKAKLKTETYVTGPRSSGDRSYNVGNTQKAVHWSAKNPQLGYNLVRFHHLI